MTTLLSRGNHKVHNKLTEITGRRLKRFRATALITVVFCANMSFAQANDDSLSLHLQRGGNDLRSEKYEEATVSFQKALDIDSLNLNALRNLGFLLALAGDHKSAIKLWERADNYGVADADVYSNLGLSYAKLGQTEKALNNYSFAMELDQENVGYMRDFATTALNAGLFEPAHIAMEEAIKLAPEDPEINYLLGNCHAGVGESVKAQLDYRKAIELGFDIPELRFNYGMMLESAGDLLGAEEQLGFASNRAPENLDYRQRLGVFYMKTGVYTQSVKNFHENLERDSTYINSRIGLAIAFANLGNMDSAYAQLAWVKKSEPARASEMMNLIKKAEDNHKRSDSSQSGN